jgi:hypothetical protein
VLRSAVLQAAQARGRTLFSLAAVQLPETESGSLSDLQARRAVPVALSSNLMLQAALPGRAFASTPTFAG